MSVFIWSNFHNKLTILQMKNSATRTIYGIIANIYRIQNQNSVSIYNRMIHQIRHEYTLQFIVKIGLAIRRDRYIIIVI